MVRKPLWPREIIEIPPSSRRDPRNEDPHATQKITRDQLEEALHRTKSGFRRAVRESRPEVEPSDPRVEPVEPEPLEPVEPVLEAPQSLEPAEPAEPLEPAEPEPPRESFIPEPVIRIKDEDLPDAGDFGHALKIATPIPRSRRAGRVVTPSMSLVPASPYRRWLPARAHVVLAIVVALLTSAALAIGYFMGRASFH